MDFARLSFFGVVVFSFFISLCGVKEGWWKFMRLSVFRLGAVLELSVVSGDCVFGDKQGSVFSSGEDCVTAVGNAKRVCYQEIVQDLCCSSCNAVYRPLQSRLCPVTDGALGGTIQLRD